MRSLKFPELNYFLKLHDMLGQNTSIEIAHPAHQSSLVLVRIDSDVQTPFGKGKQYQLSGYMDTNGYEDGIYLFRIIVIDGRTPRKKGTKNFRVIPSHAQEPDSEVLESIYTRQSRFECFHGQQEEQTELAIAFMGYLQRYVLISFNPENVKYLS